MVCLYDILVIEEVERESLILKPYGITVDMLGNLYVSDTGNNRVVIL